MPINRFDNPAELPPIDFAFLMRAKAYGDEQNEKVDKEYEALAESIGKIKSVTKDIPLRNKIVLGYNDQLKKWIDRYGESPRAGINDLRRIKRQFEQDFKYGQLGDIHSKGLEKEEALKRFEAGRKDYQGMDDVAYYQMVVKPELEYEGSKETSPGSGVYNKINWGQSRTYQDMAEKLSGFAKGWLASEEKAGRVIKIGNNYFNYQTKKEVTFEEVQAGTMQYASSDPTFVSQLRDMSDYNEYLGRQAVQQDPVTGEVYVPVVSNKVVRDAQGNESVVQEVLKIKPEEYGDFKVNEQLKGITGAIAAREAHVDYDNSLHYDQWAEYMHKVRREEEEKRKLNEMESFVMPGVQVPTGEWDDLLKQINAIKSAEYVKGKTKEGAGFSLFPSLLDASGVFEGAQKAKDKLPASMDTYLNKAAILFRGRGENGKGLIPPDYKDQIDLLEKYANYMKNRQVDMVAVAPKDWGARLKYANEVNSFYFGDIDGSKGPKGSMFVSSQPLKVVGGKGSEQTWGDIQEKYENLNFRWQGDLTPDNPYYPAGRIFVGIDEDGKEAARVVIPGSVQEQNNAAGKFLTYQPQYTGKPVDFGDYQIDYEPESAQEMTNEGMPVYQGKGKAYLIDKKTGVRSKPFSSGDPDPENPDYTEEDALRGLYKTLRIGTPTK